MSSRRRRLRIAASAIVLAAWSTEKVEGQGQVPPVLPSTRVVQAGPASLYPAISLRDVGTDSNVYIGPDPKEDFTYTVTPRLFAVVPIGGTRFTGTGRGDFIAFQTYKDQQSVNAYFDGRYEAVDSKIRPFAAASFGTRRERYGYEIDERARQTQGTITLGSDFELTAITALTGFVRRENISWDREDFYEGVSLAHQLNETVDIAGAGARFRLTPFTSVIAMAEIQRDRFESSPERDADSLRIAPSVEFDNGAAITGRAKAGYRVFKPLSAGIEGYNGFVAEAGLRYAFNDLTRLYFDGGNDVKYSYDPLQPFYLETGIRLRLIQRIIGPVEGIGLVERWQLRHQRVGGQSFDGREEDTTTFGGGIGLRMSREMEITFTIDRTERISSEPTGRDYERHRVLASISYGL